MIYQLFHAIQAMFRRQFEITGPSTVLFDVEASGSPPPSRAQYIQKISVWADYWLHVCLRSAGQLSDAADYRLLLWITLDYYGLRIT